MDQHFSPVIDDLKFSIYMVNRRTENSAETIMLYGDNITRGVNVLAESLVYVVQECGVNTRVRGSLSK